MGLCLWDGMYRLRLKLGEAVQNFWSDEELIYGLNEGLQEMCSDAQNLETAIQFPWPNTPGGTTPGQEAPLPVHVDTVFAAAVLSGQLFQLEEVQDTSQFQVANRVGTIPQMFCLRTDTTIMTPQGALGTNTADINLINLTDARGQEYTTVMSVWPIPQANLDTTIWCTRFHPTLRNPRDPVALPRKFLQPWVYYAEILAWEKRGQEGKADRARGLFKEGKAEFVAWSAARKYLKTFPSYGGTPWPTLARGSSSVIFLDQNPGLINQ